MSSIIRETALFNLLPQDLTSSSLLDRLADEKFRKRIQLPSGDYLEYHTAGMYTSELGTMIREYDQPFLNVLSKIFDCPEVYDQERRYKSTPLIIPHPQVSILGGIQPAYLAATIPNEAWGQGFMSRVIMVHSDEPSHVDDLFGETELDPKLRARLVLQLSKLSKVYGQITWTDDAKMALNTWHRKGYAPVPTAHRLAGYNQRRVVQVQKLSMIASAARGDATVVRIDDFAQALQWLLDCEEEMPKIFMEMAGRSDIDVIRDMHFWAWKKYSADKQAIHKALYMGFLGTRVSSYQAEKIFQQCLASRIIDRMAGTEEMFIPQPINIHGEVK